MYGPNETEEEKELREERQRELDRGLEERLRAVRNSGGLVTEDDVMEQYNYEKTLDNPFDYYR
jgi:hypothetical protein